MSNPFRDATVQLVLAEIKEIQPREFRDALRDLPDQLVPYQAESR